MKFQTSDHTYVIYIFGYTRCSVGEEKGIKPGCKCGDTY